MSPIQKTLILMLLAAMSSALCSCSKEEITAGGEATQGTLLNISVTDGGYALSKPSTSARNAVPRTRAVENGYATAFTAGDQIGLYVVNPDHSYAAANLRLTLTDTGSGTLVWQAPAGTKLYYEGATAKYFAYYPYRLTLEGNLVPTATTAADFFANVAWQWTPATDQSTHTAYTAQDLMTGSGTTGGKQPGDKVSLSFTMTHAMALMVIELPQTKYTFTNNPGIQDYYNPAPNTTFSGFKPYRTSAGAWLYLVKPDQTGSTGLIGNYTGGNGNTKEYTLTQNNLTAANYACYQVDGATVTTKPHTLQVGDFFMNDGSLVGKGATLNDGQKAACIGIVFQTVQSRIGDAEKATLGAPPMAW